jgi:hypothetical protein
VLFVVAHKLNKRVNIYLWRVIKSTIFHTLLIDDSVLIMVGDYFIEVTRMGGWFRHCATSRKAAVSIPEGSIVIFH